MHSDKNNRLVRYSEPTCNTIAALHFSRKREMKKPQRVALVEISISHIDGSQKRFFMMSKILQFTFGSFKFYKTFPVPVSD